MNKGDLRLIPSFTKVWSDTNLMHVVLTKDVICQITMVHNNDVIWVRPMELIFNAPGQIPAIVGKGQDTWQLEASKTKSYEIPKPLIYKWDYTNKSANNASLNIPHG